MKKLFFVFAALLVIGLAVAIVASSDNDEITKESNSLVLDKSEKADFMAFKCGEEAEESEAEGAETEATEADDTDEEAAEESTEEEKCGEGKCGEGESDDE